MKRSSMFAGLGAAAILIALGSAIAVHAHDASTAHYMDGEGYLASSNGKGGVTETFGQDGRAQGPFSFGLRLCLRGGASQATLVKVVPNQLVGDSLVFKGSIARNVDVSTGSAQTPIVSSVGFPPHQSTSTQPEPGFVPVKGFVVKGRCGDPSAYDELVVGAEIGSGTQGGGVIGIDVTYQAKGHQHVVTMPDVLLVCGPAVAPYDAKHSCSS